MKQRKLLFWILIIVGLCIAATVTYKLLFREKKSLPYTTQNPERRTIKKIIDTTGKLSVAQKVKIGSLVTGTVEEILVEENDYVQKGQLLAIIDTGKGDTDVRQAQGQFDRAQAVYRYQENTYRRQEGLYNSGQLAKDEFEQVEQEYLTSKANYDIARAQLDKAAQEYANTKIYAKQEGIIIDIGVSEGERVTTDLDATILFVIAKDVTKMEANLEIDESNIGHARVGQTVKFTVETFPHKKFVTVIKQISYSPKRTSGVLFYKGTVDVDNSEKKLRPGLSIDAQISVAKSKEALSLPSQAFMISSRVLKEIAKDLEYSFNSADRKQVKHKRKESDHPVQTVWVVQRNGFPHTFVEKIVTTNITDDIYFEITSGLDESDDVIVDIEESGYMEEIYKKIFGNKF